MNTQFQEEKLLYDEQNLFLLHNSQVFALYTVPFHFFHVPNFLDLDTNQKIKSAHALSANQTLIN